MKKRRDTQITAALILGAATILAAILTALAGAALDRRQTSRLQSVAANVDAPDPAPLRPAQVVEHAVPSSLRPQEGDTEEPRPSTTPLSPIREDDYSTSLKVTDAGRSPFYRVLTMGPGKAVLIDELATTVTVDFRSTLGSRYVELTVTSPGEKPSRVPARSPGAEFSFSVGGIAYSGQISAIDQQQRTVEVVIRSVAPLS